MLVSDLIARNARWYPDQIAVIDVVQNVRLSWSEVHNRTSRFANALLNLGLQTGDRVALVMANSFQFFEQYFTFAKCGLIGVPVNLRLHPKEMASYLNYTKPRAIICTPAFADLSVNLRSTVPSVEFLVGAYGDHGLDLDYEDLLKNGSPSLPDTEICADAPYFLCPTSGTTGIPKACIHTQTTGMSASIFWLGHDLHYSSDSRHMVVAPMYFGSCGPSVFTPIHKGGAILLTPPFEPESFMKIAVEEKATHASVSNAHLSMVMNHPNVGKYDLSKFRHIVSGGTPLNAEFLRRATGIFGNVFRIVYGGTEWSTGSNILTPDDMIIDGTPQQLKRLGSAGKPIVGVDVRVVDDHGADVPTGEPGEVVVRGFNVTKGYWEMPEETKNAYRNGWFHTGDVGILDEDNFLYIVDRLKDMIKSGGMSVFSVEVERVVNDHPAVMMCAVIGVPDPKWHESVKAFVVLKPGQSATEADIIRHCRNNMGAYKVPKSVEFALGLPMTSTGKILKRTLREKYSNSQ